MSKRREIDLTHLTGGITWDMMVELCIRYEHLQGQLHAATYAYEQASPSLTEESPGSQDIARWYGLADENVSDAQTMEEGRRLYQTDSLFHTIVDQMVVNFKTEATSPRLLLLATLMAQQLYKERANAS